MRRAMTPAEKTRDKIAKEEKRLASLKVKQDDILQSIKDCEEEITRLHNQEKQEMLNDIASLITQKGSSVSELLTALQNSNLYDIQERLEGIAPVVPATSVTPAESVPDVQEDTEEAGVVTETPEYGDYTQREEQFV